MHEAYICKITCVKQIHDYTKTIHPPTYTLKLWHIAIDIKKKFNLKVTAKSDNVIIVWHMSANVGMLKLFGILADVENSPNMKAPKFLFDI